MKKFVLFTGIIILVLMYSILIYAEENYEDNMTVEFSDPGKPGLVRVLYGSGNIHITGYNGKSVTIKTKSKDENFVNQKDDEKAKGLKRISGSSFHVATIEDENAVVITRSSKQEIELFIQVPFKASLQLGDKYLTEKGFWDTSLKEVKLYKNISNKIEKIKNEKEKIKNKELFFPPPILKISGNFRGSVDIKNVSGEMEINTMDGNITLMDISGGVLANTTNGDMLFIFKEVSSESTMYFSTVSGDIDVTFPSNVQAEMMLQCFEGDIYTDFDMDVMKKADVYKEKTNEYSNLGYRNQPNNITGKLNGGGQEIQMKTISGNIYIRKGE